MCRVLALRRRPIVTAGAVSGDTGVIKRRPGKRREGLVASFARLRRYNVCRVLALRRRPVVAAGAVSGDACVLERRTRKGRERFMAIFADI
jgi:hypothetical protein